MSKPAQGPREDTTPLERITRAITEVLILALSFVAGMSVLMVFMLIGVIPDPELASWSGILAGPLMLGAAGAAYMGTEHLLARGESPRPLRSRTERKGAGTSVLIVVCAVVVALVGSALLGLIQEQLFSTEVEEQQVIVDLVRRGDFMELMLLATSAVILAPLTEELLFRHMFFRRLMHRSGPTMAWLLPALAFSLAHWNPVGVAIYMWLGLVFAYSYLVSGRLWVAMAVHAGHNAIALALLVWLPEAWIGL